MGRIRLLLVDGTTPRRERTVEALEAGSEALEIHTATDVESALKVLDTGIDCVVVGDVSSGSGWVELIRTIRRHYRLLPIVLFTDSWTDALPNAAMSAGATGHVRTDEHDDPHAVLVDRIRQLVDRYRTGIGARGADERANEYFELAGVMMVALDPDGCIVRINERGAETLGYGVDELIGEDWFDVAIPPDEQAPTREAFERLMAGDVEEYEVVRTEVETRNGDRRLIEWRNNVLTDETGTVSGTLSAGRDVTEQEAQAAAIEAERDRFLALFENIPEPAIVSAFEDGEPIVTEVNRSFERVFGFDAESVIGRNIDSVIVPPEDEAAAGEFNQELVDGNSVQAEVTRMTTTGLRDFRLHVVPLKPGTENVEGYAIYEDISELKSRQRVLEGLHAAATEIVSATSTVAVCERTVEAAEDILQFDLCEISLEQDGKLVPTASSEEIDETIPSAVSVEEGLAGKTYRSGTPYVVGDLASVEEAKPQGPWSSALSVPIGTHGIFQAAAIDADAFDETDLELAELLISHTDETLTRIQKESALRDREEALREQNERLEKFTSVLSHDLRNPLNVASGELELARQSHDDPHLEKVAQAHGRMRELVDDVLTLARSDQAVTDPEPIDLRGTLGDCFGNVHTETATLTISTDQVVLGDPSRLRSMFENLFRNAVEHAGPEVEINVGAMPDGFYIEDDGTGIPPDEREAVLEAGYTTGENGTGLGLNIVAEIAEAHGWSMTIAASESGGARFEFTGVDTVETPAEHEN